MVLACSRDNIYSTKIPNFGVHEENRHSEFFKYVTLVLAHVTEMQRLGW